MVFIHESAPGSGRKQSVASPSSSALDASLAAAVKIRFLGILADILKSLGDNKKHMRECALNTLDLWLAAVHLEKLKPYGGLQISVGASKGVQKAKKSTANGVPKHRNKAASSRAVATKGARSEPIPVQDIALQSQALLNIKDSNKEDRERMVIRKFKFEDPYIEQIQDLESDMIRYFREDLSRRLLSADFKKQVDGLEMLQKALPSLAKEIIEVLDTFLRWFVLQFCKSNTTCLLKVLEFLPELLDTLKDEGYSLTESEVAIFLPCLVEKLGHNIEKVREKMRELTKQFVLLYFAPKCFPYILEGLRSKNNRTRIECADLVGFILEHHGSDVMYGKLKSLQIVASLTVERDNETKKAALNTLVTRYKILGEDIWRFVGKLTDAQKRMLDEKFKWKVREMEKKKESQGKSDVAEQSGEVARSLSGLILRKNFGQLEVERQSMPRPMAVASGPTDWNEALDIISFGSPEQSIEGMKVICHELAQATSDPEGSAMDELVKDADRSGACLANKARYS
ncbi:hypothetical protein Ahy_B02g060005 [Arachis hypogaea]|uniref:TOG domain-containing protein n=1 Tax=Arachis hypogaea TaxID=3818 RepID=A0A445AHM6_ARAHY|nr:hypothetical protein Ahy_B02g060005 [Arachis hypogaea]